jgi:hypothetical protein
MPTRITFVTARGFDVEEDIEDVERRLSASDGLLVRFEVSRGGRMEAGARQPGAGRVPRAD